MGVRLRCEIFYGGVKILYMLRLKIKVKYK